MLGYTVPMKTVGHPPRLQRNMRDGFLEGCRPQDQGAAQALCDFMRGYVRRQDAAQDDSAASDKRPQQRSSNDH
jgi:hypothetical protein